jgi:putative sigma-54 modulation protein
MTKLPIHITTHHLIINEGLHRFVLKKIGALKRFANDALAAEIVLRRDGLKELRFSAIARVSLPGRDIHARASDGNIYAAIHQLVSKLARLSRKRKTRLSRNRSNRTTSRSAAGLAMDTI